MDWRLNGRFKPTLGEKQGVDLIDFETLTLNESWKERMSSMTSPVLLIWKRFSQKRSKRSRRMMIVILDFQKRAFFDIHKAISGDFSDTPHDADSLLKNGEATGLRI